MTLLAAGLLLAVSFCLGALPLTRWVVWLLAGKDLTQVGTSNVGVSAAFLQGGKPAGIAAVLVEITRGIAPVLVAKAWFSDWPALPIVASIALVVGRSAIAKGGGVTNATWGILAYSPPIAFGSGITGLLILSLGQSLRSRHRGVWRLRAARWGCLSAPLWGWLCHQSPLELIAITGLAFLLVAINLHQADDMALSKHQQFYSLNQSLDPQICGEKAARLSQLKQAGFNVPSGWILPPSTTRIESEKFPISPTQPLIIRSSALGEDSDTSSAAGQYQTIGPVTTSSELVDAIHRCRQSYWSSEAIAYRRQRQLPDTGMAVLIQPYLNSQVAGVMFSRNPLDGGCQIIIEALAGGAEAVVGGQITPLHLEIDGRISVDSLPNYNQSILSKTLLSQLVTIAQKIEIFFHGIPQDIEWSWDGETLWILQSRPITNLRPIWTRTIAAEVIPGAIHPLTWSINRPLTCGVWGEIFQIVLGEKATNLDFNQTATLLGSHAYFNATLLGEIFRKMGLPEQGLEFLVRGQKIGKPPLKTMLPNLPGLWRLVQRERAIEREFNRDFRTIFLPALQSLESGVADSSTEQFLKTNKDLGKLEISNHCSEKFSLNSLSLPELLSRAEQIQAWLKPITYYNILGPIGLAIRKALLRVPDGWLPNETAPEIASVRSLQQLAERLREKALSTDELEEALTHDPEFIAEFQQWLNTYGYLSEVGTDIAVPTWREHPETFQSLLIQMAQRPSNSHETENQMNSLNWRQKWRLAACKDRAVIKNRISEIYGRLLAHLRWTFLAIEAEGLKQKKFAQAGDIFYLEFSEIQQWIRRGEEINFQEKIRQRREQLQRDRTRTVPAVVYGNLLPKTPTQPANEIAPETSTPSILQGIPASIGCVEGSVKVYRTVTAITHADNQIVVVPYTDAGWAPLLLQAKAIIAEVGGQLSHGAIIAREYGIPAVMNIPEATTRLKDGQRVRVDGYRGTVEFLE